MKRNGSISHPTINRIARAFDPHAERLSELWRYYKVGLINTAFGYGLYAILVFCGLNLYVAQILSHTTGAAFNYFMFRRHVFRNTIPAIGRYIAAYAANYLMGLATLSISHHFISSAYLAGFTALVVISVINYFILKGFVFKSRAQSQQ